jgi:peptidyl-prolyl cis-trans isomerase B (cyclophilin B)
VPSSSKREREAARRRYERRQAQRQYKRSRARRRNAIIGATLATLLVIGGVVAAALTLSNDKTSKTTAASSASATPSASASASPTLPPGTCGYTKAPEAQKGTVKDVGTPPAKPDLTTPYVATMTTSVGTIKIDLLTSKAPCTVNSFKYLASKKYFDGTSCHRLTTSGIFVLQCGDPSGTGAGGPGYQFPDENLTGATYPAGTVAMANAGAGTNGSQFFLVYKDTKLPPSYTPFGKVVSGLDVITTVAKAGTDNANGQGDGHPKTKVVIKTFTVTKA